MTFLRCSLFIASAAALCLCSEISAQKPRDGGRDVSVALFTAHDVRSVAITPAVAGAWFAACYTCLRKPLAGRVVVSTGEVFLGGAVRVEDASNSATAATATGLWHVRAHPHGMDVVLTIPSERYTAAAVAGEAAVDEPAESLRALAVVARTYALNGPHYSAGAGHLPADLCDNTQCQALRFGKVSSAVADAVSSTAGETLWFGLRRAEVFFSGHCGGESADATEAWFSAATTQRSAMPYLHHHPDPFCVRASTAVWHTSISPEELTHVAQAEGWRIPARLTRALVVQHSASGRAVRLALQGADGQASPLSASSLRFAVGRTLGWNRIRSDLYTVTVHDGALVLDGRGHGHGVGLCQAGAKVMAEEHRDMRSILAFYFPGTHLGITLADNGWTVTRVDAVTVRSTTSLSKSQQQAVAAAWQFALKTFPVATTPDPTVVFAPTTELFRQMTAQPGWDLASTRDNMVTLQPEAVLRHAGGTMEETLRHELLHVLVERESNGRAPLWLREGLVEALIGHASQLAAPLAASAIEAQLLQPTSQTAAARAHAAAGARAANLITRYGLSTVRGWLRSGVPASVTAEMEPASLSSANTVSNAREKHSR